MKQLNRYIFWQVVGTTCFVSAVLCMTVVLVQSIRLIDLIVSRGLSFLSFSWLLLLMSPRLLSYVLPVTVFIGILTCYRRLTAESELTVMKAVGFSDANLQYGGLMAGLLFTFIGYGLSMFVVPMSHQALQAELFKHKSQWSAALVQEGKFSNIGKSITLYVRERNGDQLNGLMYDNREDPQNTFIIFAKYGRLIDDAGVPKIVISDGNRQSFQDGVLQLVAFDQTIVEINSANPLVGNTEKPVESRLLHELLNPSQLDIARDGYVDELKTQAYKMLTQPLLIIALILIAFAVLFGIPFSRSAGVKPVIILSLTGGLVMVIHLGLTIIAVDYQILNHALYIFPILVWATAGYVALTPKYWKKIERKRLPPSAIKDNISQDNVIAKGGIT